MRSAWICTRNDVLGNLAVLLAALGVFGTGSGWPDMIVAAILAGLALQGASIVVIRALAELRSTRRPQIIAAEPVGREPGRPRLNANLSSCPTPRLRR
jgi:Co/Zn/Cd efflux system component